METIEQDKAFQEGYSAAKAFDVSCFPDNNPYKKGTPNYENWYSGWRTYFCKKKEKFS